MVEERAAAWLNLMSEIFEHVMSESVGEREREREKKRKEKKSVFNF